MSILVYLLGVVIAFVVGLHWLRNRQVGTFNKDIQIISLFTVLWPLIPLIILYTLIKGLFGATRQ